MALDPQLLEVLACPEDKGPLLYFEDEQVLYNPRLKRTYPVRDDIPVNGRTESYLGTMATMSESIGTAGFKKSSMCRQMQAGNYRAACEAILLYKYAGKTDCSDPANRTCRGLWNDRKKSHAACLEAIP